VAHTVYFGNFQVFINARDDPLVHLELLEPVKSYSTTNPKALFIELANGGHLGFYEGGLISPNPVSWIDRAVVAIIGGIVLSHNNDMPKLIKSKISI
jgi:abhydrolase domain-containing protein 2